ncbi:MAG TPA: protoporphyrinogen oxidase [Acidimicrobiales bacterium]|nr:protoporphyrinogen oxidase [Acidimicrobiales bacterium]
MRIAIVGGGIAGLAAAWELRGDAELTVFDPGPLGGRVRTSVFGGKMVDEGADAFITRVPHALQLCRELGLTDRLVAPQAGRSLLWWDGRLRPLPAGLVLGVPTSLRALRQGGLLSRAAIARVALEPLVPRTRSVDDVSVRDLIKRRYGRQVADRLVEPLVGGISAGWTGELGALEVTPQIAAAARDNRSLMRALGRVLRDRPESTEPMFQTPLGGMGELVDALVTQLSEHGVSFRAEEVTELTVGPTGAVTLGPFGDSFDGAVLATPAAVSARLLQPETPSGLDRIATSSVAIVTVALGGAELPPGFNGFLVPRQENHLMTACSFASNKWPHWTDDDRPLVRISCGRRGDNRFADLTDDALVECLVGELGDALGQKPVAVEARVSRWPDSFAQYLVGHTRRGQEIAEVLRRTHPHVRLAGASYSGIGIPACIGSGRQAADELRNAIRLRPPVRH